MRVTALFTTRPRPRIFTTRRPISPRSSTRSGSDMVQRSDLPRIIDEAWEARDQIGPGTKGDVRDAVAYALDDLDSGALRVAEKHKGEWVVHQWLKKAVLLSFRLNDM